jgi:hypothetical protein
LKRKRGRIADCDGFLKIAMLHRERVSQGPMTTVVDFPVEAVVA